MRCTMNVSAYAGGGCMADAHVIRVMAVDDHPLMMAGISGEINAQSDMRVVAEASDGDEALVLFRKHQPDVTLMDIRMPKVNGIVAISAIRAEFPQARVIVLTTARAMSRLFEPSRQERSLTF
jgi:DNA-binding NarL/FixJ family response regulator